MTAIQKYLIACLFAAGTLTPTCAQNRPAEKPYFYAIGDMPYDAGEAEQYVKLIVHINGTTPLFTVHVGDTKSGHVDCSDESYTATREIFNSFEQPLMYTPGDNEWTDCHKKECGGYLAAERLSCLRKTVYEHPLQSFGKRKLKVDNESAVEGFEKFVENAAWQQHDVMFCTVHVCGSGNNYYSKAGKEEFAEREKADLFWLDRTFEQATAEGMKGVVICFHANIFQGKKDEGYAKILESLERHSKEFGKPVLAIYGDTHTYQVSKPLHNNGLLRNFTALQVFGSPDVYAVKVFIDETSKDLFRFEPVYLD